jgi:NAD+ synthase (glutamine-hydrolysing)
MKISVAQLNYHIGNFERNKYLICKAIDKAKADGSDLVVFSELCIPGYPPLDLLDRVDFVEKCDRTVSEIAAIAAGMRQLSVSTFNSNPKGRLFNSALVISEGKVVLRYIRPFYLPMTYLMSTGIFNRRRTSGPFHSGG